MSKPDELTPGKAQPLRRISTEEVKRSMDVTDALDRYARHQKRRGFCECDHCKLIRDAVQQAIGE